VLFSQPERCWACSLNQGQSSKLSQNMLHEVLTAVTAFHLETTGQPEWKIGHEVTVYESSTIAAQVKAVIHFYPHLWEDCSNVMKVSEKEWMNILLIDDWEAKYKPEQAHVYSVS
jgi:hypothetical protein